MMKYYNKLSHFNLKRVSINEYIVATCTFHTVESEINKISTKFLPFSSSDVFKIALDKEHLRVSLT